MRRRDIAACSGSGIGSRHVDLHISAAALQARLHDGLLELAFSHVASTSAVRQAWCYDIISKMFTVRFRLPLDLSGVVLERTS